MDEIEYPDAELEKELINLTETVVQNFVNGVAANTTELIWEVFREGFQMGVKYTVNNYISKDAKDAKNSLSDQSGE